MKLKQTNRIAERGFSLIELMIVIAIIGILIAVGVTGWKAAVKSANEAAAIKTLRTIAEQQMLFYNSHQRSSFGSFDEMLKENMLDTRFAGTTPVVEGYVFQMRVIPKSTTTSQVTQSTPIRRLPKASALRERTISISTRTATQSTSTPASLQLSLTHRSDGS